MMWNSEYLIITYPRMAARTIYHFFARSLQAPIYSKLSRLQFKSAQESKMNPIYNSFTSGHENLKAASDILYCHGRDISQFRAVFLPIRNPFNLAISTYLFYKTEAKNNPGKKNFELALNNSFDEFMAQYNAPDYNNWVTINNNKPDNLVFLPVENLNAELLSVAHKYPNINYHSPSHLNKSESVDMSEFINKKTIELITKKFASVYKYQNK